MIFYESPYRIVKTLEQFGSTFGESREVSLTRELSKKFEQTVRGTIPEVLAHFREHEPKGEFVIVVAGAPKPEKKRRLSNAERYGLKNESESEENE